MIKIFGYSDDLLEIEGKFIGEDEIPCYDKEIAIEVNDPDTQSGVVVIAEYAHKNREGVWMIAVEPIKDEYPMPKMSIEMYKSGYSPLLIIDCYENTTVKVLNPEGGEG